MPAIQPLTHKTFFIAVSGVLILWLPVLLLHLTVALFAALIVYSATRSAAGLLRRRFDWHHAELICLLALLAALFMGLYAMGNWIGTKIGTGSLTALMQQMVVILDQLHNTLPASISQHIPFSLPDLHTTVTEALRTHAAQLQMAGAHTLRNVGHAIIGIVIGGIAVLQIPAKPQANAKPLVRRLRSHFDELVHGFSDVFFAQIRISLINTVLTAIYLVGILPLAGHPLPMTGTLIVITFVVGLIPVVGNLISNVVIVVLSLSDSLTVAGMSLGWLVLIHKLEYFLNAEIIGHNIRSKAWELLIIMLICESAFGIAGLVAAPVIYAQIKRILMHHGWV